MKKISLTIFLFLLVPLLAVNASKFIRYSGGDYMLAVADSLGSNRIATISVDLNDNHRVKTLEVLNNSTSEYEVLIEIKSDISFNPDNGVDRIQFSGNYLAFNYRDNIEDTIVLAVYDISGNEPSLLMSRNIWVSSSQGKFSLYDNYLVFQGFKNDNDVFSDAKIAYINLEGDIGEIIKINESDDFEYWNPFIYKNMVYCERNNYIYSYNLETGEEEELTELVGETAKNIRVNDRYVVYRSFLNGEKNFIAYDREIKTSRVAYRYLEKNNIDWVDLKGNYLAFVERAERKRMYLYNIKTDYTHFLESDSFNLAYPSLSDDLFFWTSQRDGAYEIYYAGLDSLKDNDDFINLANIFNIKEEVTEKHEWNIFLQVDRNGEAWYVH